METLYITGAGVSAESGIPTFRGTDGFWTIGSKNYTPMQMATRKMYHDNPIEFLTWYYNRFATYRNHGPNEVHHWLANKNLITQNIDGLDGKAGNDNYIAIHGRLDQMTLYHPQGEPAEIMHTPWDDLDQDNLQDSLLDLFRINKQLQHPEINKSLKPFVLLFDEFYTDLYRIEEAQERMIHAERMVFIGTSFSVNITQMALEAAITHGIPVEIVDPQPVKLANESAFSKITYHEIKASEYIHKH